MRDRIAEELLAKVLEWTAEDVAAERPIVQALAAYKYDEYQQFSTGSKFIESLALWLSQFRTAGERRTAYDFVKTRLVFFSAAEMRHLVEMAYTDHVRPFLIERVSSGGGRFRPKSIATSIDFKVRQRQCLFLGLSDGARIDAFRRANPDLNHEQIWQTHELSSERIDKLLEKLAGHLRGLLGREPVDDEKRFRTLVLLDDFSASGTSYYSLPPQAPTGGKVMGFFERMCEHADGSRLVDPKDFEVFTLLYMATEDALRHMREASAATWGKHGVPFTVEAVQQLPTSIKLSFGENTSLNKLIEDPEYYDDAIHDSHMKKGGTKDSRYGYAACGLPLVLHHNTPNNSIALLMSYEDLHFRGLFPRIQRHREMS